jgi:signal peptidase I
VAAQDDSPKPARSPVLSRRVRSWLEWAIVIIGALAISFGIRGYLVQTFSIPSASMVPTLQVGDRILVNKQTSDLSELSRGDIVVFPTRSRPTSTTS